MCCSSLFLVSLDHTALNVALPDIQRDLDTSVAGLQWTIDAYLIVLASSLLLAGALGDRVGRRRVFRCGLVLFTAASLGCSLAPSLGWLIGFRAAQAVGGSMLTPVALAIITQVFTERRARARAIGLWSAVQGVTLAVGPLVGGLAVDAAGWRWIFLLNLPVGALALALAPRVPESRSPHPRRTDAAGQTLMAVTLAAVTFGVIEGPVGGWTSPAVLAALGLSVLALPTFVVTELRLDEPLIDPRFFRRPAFTAAALSAAFAFAALSGFLFLATLQLQVVRGLSAWQAGLWLLPMAIMTCVLPPLSGRLTALRGAHVPLALSGVGMALGGLLPALAGTGRPTVLICSFVLFGAGFGLLNAPVNQTAVESMPKAQAGVASAITTTTRQIGSALGVAVIGASLAGPAHTAAAFGRADQAGWWVIAGCGVAVLALSPLARTARRGTTSNFGIPISDSQTATHL
ncbi:MFS transporter [Streptomyces sp. NPDC053750]|uniref:MFS transporter n=1 Tax=Streptomyces sp. NPDC053750 TaxID=3365714 RepID=UPI0037CE7B5C